MARRFSTVVFAVMVVAALVQSSKAETHEVGDDLKWTVPSNGSVAYQNWAAGETFLLGDVLGTQTNSFMLFSFLYKRSGGLY